MIIQDYVESPYLIDGYKFDLRIYVTVLGCDPLRAVVFSDGLARFSTDPYQEPNLNNIDNSFMHLTNYAINKHAQNFQRSGSFKSKR